MDIATLILIAVVILVVATFIAKAVVLMPQGEAAVIERLGSYTRTISDGIGMIIPFIDRVRARVDTRERVVSFPPQAVITQDNLTVAIDIVVTFQINDPARAIYGVDNYIVGVEQISVATLRDVVGGMTLEETLTSRDIINRRLRGELDGATTKWGLRISRVELKAIDPPPSIQQSMEMQMKAEREKRAMILTAEGRANPTFVPPRVRNRPAFSPPRAKNTQPSSGPRPSGRQLSSGRRVNAPPNTSRPRVRPGRSRKSTPPSATPRSPPNCLPTSTWKNSPSLPRAKPPPCG